MIPRHRHAEAVEDLLRQFPVVALLGARQTGKTTLARAIAARAGRPSRLFDLEDARDIALLAEPTLALEPLRGLVVLDEIHRRPELFPALRVLADRPGRPARFLVLGSASADLLRQTSESLAGRIGFHVLPGLSMGETGPRRLARLWLRGGFPASFTAKDDGLSLRWRAAFAKTFVERDLPGFGVRVPPATMERFWAMLAHRHGQVWNASAFAASFGVSDVTVRHYLDVLASTFVARLLLPWHENIGKRQVKSPKVWFSDPGLLHHFLGIRDQRDLERHPSLGASWEGFAQEQVVARLGAGPRECFFWATHHGAELDLLVVRGRRRLGFEIKRTDAPGVTPSMRIALADLKLDRLDVIHAGHRTFPLAADIRAVALERILEDVEPLR